MGGPDERDLSGALRFAHLCEVQGRVELARVRVEIDALTRTLVELGVLQEAELAVARQRQLGVYDARTADDLHVRADPTEGKYEVEPVRIDCAAHLEACKAACCRWLFALSLEDVREGIIRWRYDAPYVIRHDDGRCVHNDLAGACDAHAARPARCRRYDCRDDPRVWKDYARRIPSDEVAALPSLAGR